jgi:parallel beta-helix repeat protein
MKFIRYLSVALLFSIFIVFYSSIAGAVDWNVEPCNGDFCSLQSAIDKASDGDTIFVYPGTYNEQLLFDGSKKITVRSTGGPEVTTLDGTGKSGSVVRFIGGDGSVLEGFTVTRGISSSNGGGISCGDSSSPTISNCIITSNKSTAGNGKGGGVYCYGINSFPTITDCIISSNIAGYGGGIYLLSKYEAITKCTIKNNTATNSGGGIYYQGYGSTPPITNCIISGNEANEGGAFYLRGYGSSPSIINCTVTRNTANSIGGGIYTFLGAFATVKNTILWENNPEELNRSYTARPFVVTHSDVLGGWGTPADNNIDEDPKFEDPDIGDFHLKADSPCINAGDCDGAPSDDMDNNPRPQGGRWCDIGAYEYPLGFVGDVDGSGCVDAFDAECLYKWVLGMPSCLDGVDLSNCLNCDINGDGTTNAFDADCLYKWVLGMPSCLDGFDVQSCF